MSGSSIIIIICGLLLLAYVFDLTAKKTKIPSVILLIALGLVVKQLAVLFKINVPNLFVLLPVFGTIGLILIVLEGSLELEFNKKKFPLIKKSLILALLPLFLSGFGIAYAFYYFGQYDFKISLINALPLCIISSAIAIPTALHLSKSNRDFITYESTLSDILGVIVFNFILLNETIDIYAIGFFGVEIILLLVISLLATIGLSLLLKNINHHIKFGPIIILVVLIYTVAKLYHLPALLFIMLFGIFIGNQVELKNSKLLQKLKPESFSKEVRQFKEIVIEATFLIRSLFFLLFGFLIEANEIINTKVMVWSIPIVASIFLIRFIFLYFARLPLLPLLFIAPRGLITILLFFTIPNDKKIPLVNETLILQIIIFSAFIMMFGMMFTKKQHTISEQH